MSVDRRDFLKRLAAGAALLVPAAFLAGCPSQTDTTTETVPPEDISPPDQGAGADAESHEHEGEEAHEHEGGEAEPAGAGVVLGVDPAQRASMEGLPTFECPECHALNAVPDYQPGAAIPKLKCRVCGHVWQPE